MKKKRTIIIGVTGGIAAYKACELVSSLVQKGYNIRVVMTEAAQRFVTPITFQALSGNLVIKDIFQEQEESLPEHIALSTEADLLVIAPATANIIGKLASGIADDILTTTVLSMKCPVVICPSMNVNMWKNQVVQSNIKTLKKSGSEIIEPEVGWLCCGHIGKGRLADIKKVIEKIENILNPKTRTPKIK